MRARRLVFLVLATVYLCAAAFGIAVYFIDDRDAMRGVLAMLTTVPWSFSIVLLPRGQGDWPSAFVVMFFGLCAFLNVGVLAVLLGPFRKA